jgi:cell division protein FtsW
VKKKGRLNVDKIRGTPDFLLLFLTLALVGFGIIMVFSASSIQAFWQFGDSWYVAKKQIVWACIGLVAMLFTMNLPYTMYKRIYVLIGIGSLLLLLTVFIPGIGVEVNGAKGWISIGDQRLQPAEFAKLGLVIYLSAVISHKGERIRQFSHGLVPLLIIIGLFVIIIILQNDFGSAAILLGTSLIVVICGGARIIHVVGLFLLALPFLIIFIVSAPYRLNRILSFLDPWAYPDTSGYHLIQSLYAIAHGKITGVGLGQSIQKYHYLPFPQTDFIFSIIAEELGFIGSVIFILAYLLLLWRALLISLQAKDTFASLVGIGVVSGIGIQAVINIGGVTGTIPITGVPLPLISYGGSSLLVTMIGIGMLLGISREVNRQHSLELKKAAA